MEEDLYIPQDWRIRFPSTVPSTTSHTLERGGEGGMRTSGDGGEGEDCESKTLQLLSFLEGWEHLESKVIIS